MEESSGKERGGRGRDGKQQSPGTHGQFMGDEFRSYMSRKIELQRRQFGLVLPPAPDDSSSSRFNFSGGSDEVDSRGAQGLATQSTKMEAKGDAQGTSAEKPSSGCDGDRGGSKRKRMGGGLSGVLSRLKQKHGTGSGRKASSRKRRRRRESSSASEGSTARSSEGYDPAELEKSFVVGAVPKSMDSEQGGGRESRDRLEIPSNLPMTPQATKVPVLRHRPDLFFLGVVVLVNGFTTPDASTLMRMLQNRGGDLEKYETSRVTHIIASTLSTAKALIYKRQRNPTPVVRPEWIVDSCREGKLLSHADYLLEEVRDENTGSKTVMSFFSPNPSREGPSSDRKTGAFAGHGPGQNAPSPTHTIINPAMKEAQPTQGPEFDEEVTKNVMPSSPRLQTQKKLPETPSPKRDAPAGVDLKVRTVGTDPHFLDSYFSNSRLSFIGSFKQRMKASGSSATTSSPISQRCARTKAHRFVFHVDIDCFFAAVALRKYPQYRDKPVAVGHGWRTDSEGQPVPVGDGACTFTGGGEKKSYSELSTCNYTARKFGLRKGMFLHQATSLCPNLIVLPYDYEGYEEVTLRVTEILHHHADECEGAVEQVSCDEAYLEAFLGGRDVEREKEMPYDLAKSIAETIRSEIFASTECTASIGVARNKFLAKLATDKAKPDGSFVVKEYRELLENLQLRDLPGIGWKLERKLKAHHLQTVRDVLVLGDEAESELCSILGMGNGRKILNYIEGRDDRKVQAVPRKTIGAECNYGVRFDGPYGPDYMLKGLATEVEKRMKAVDVNGKRITLKIMQRKEGASNPAKFLGHGSCNNLSKSCDLPVSVPTRDSSTIFRTGMELFDAMAVNKDDIRGMGIVISKLDNTGALADTGASKMSTWLKGGTVEKESKERQNDTNGESSSVLKSGTCEESSKEEAVSHNVSQPGGKSGTVASGQSKRNVGRRTVRFSTEVQCRDSSEFSPQSFAASDASTQAAHPKTSCGTSSEREEDYVIPTLSQIDEEVFTHLPKDIQSSVRRKLHLDSEKSNGPNCESASASRNSSSEKRHEADEACIRKREQDASTPLSLGERGSAPEDSGDAVVLSIEDTPKDDAAEVHNDLHGGIVLPPLSQIDRNEVMALPAPMREEVLKQIAKEESRRISNGHCPLSPQDQSRTLLEQSPARQCARKDSDCDGHFRQLSVRRMLKLASVKSGNDHLEESFGGESISLTQLESLPFEMQLQVANNDDAPVGIASLRTSKMRNAAHKPAPPQPDKKQRCSENSPSRAPANALNVCGNPESSQQSSVAPPRVEELPPQTGMLVASEEIDFESMQDFYHSNALPLNKWMDGIPAPSCEEIERMKEFFFVCMSEKRLDEVVKMLRVIRRRPDDWGNGPFSSILDGVDERLVATEGRRLDRRLLGLT